MAAVDPLRVLVTLLRSGLTPRQALLAWPAELSGAAGAEARTLARRLELGHPIASSLRDSSLADILVPAFSVHLSTGADLACWLERVANDLADRAASIKAARGAAAGAALSGRMVAALPLLFVPLTPAPRAPLTDGVGIVMLVAGVLLAACGLRWIERLLPRPPQEDSTATLCLLLSAMLRAGMSLAAALRLAATQVCASAPLKKAAQLTALGFTWPEAMAEAGGECADIATSIRRAQRFGVPLAESLDSLATARRAEQDQLFEEKMKRAPVLMVVPLTCCILPAYALLAFGPFLRSMTVG